MGDEGLGGAGKSGCACCLGLGSDQKRLQRLDVIRKIFGVHQPVPDTHYLIPDLAPSHHESQWHNKLSARQLRLKSSLGMTPVYAFQ